MTKHLSLLEAIELFAVLPLEVKHENHRALERVGKLIEKEARRVIGTYDYGWKQLAESTQSDRESHGYEPDEPLLRTGALRDSIRYTVGHNEVTIGSDSQIARWQELGTSRIPPRPFLSGAAHQKMPEVLHIIGDAVVSAISGTNKSGAGEE